VDEVLVERAKMLRTQAGPAEAAFIKEFNDVFQTLRVQKGFMTSTRTLPERTDGPAGATFSHAPLYWALRRWMTGSWCSNSIHAFDFGKREALSHG
jgi:hypothetical protein